MESRERRSQFQIQPRYSEGKEWETVALQEGLFYDIHFGSVGIYSGYGTAEEIKLTQLYSNTFFGEL